MRRTLRPLALVQVLALLTSLALGQEPNNQHKKPTIAPAAAANPVAGSGTAGQVTKWLGLDSANSFSIGDSNITEDKFGKVGIGTRTPTSPLTVRGMIETTLGGIKFPDGTTQTTSATGALFVVAHDLTLQGNGTAASPLSVAVPFVLSGSVANPDAIMKATNTSPGGAAIHGVGGIGAGLFFGIPVGVMGDSDVGVGVLGNSNKDSGVIGISNSADDSKAGVQGICNNCSGVRGISENGIGVTGQGGTGVSGTGNNGGGIGVSGTGGASSSIGGVGVFGVGGMASGAGNRGGDGISGFGGLAVNGAAFGFAGKFVGDVDVQGKLTKTMGTFKIDHPLDPENKYLFHSFVESPDMMNIYNGNITTDPNGEAVVEMPDYFEALNRDFRYQLTVIGTFAQAIVASEMKGNRFVIKTNAPGVKVSWMVTGVRHDAYAEKNRVQVEEVKSETERGYYLHPEVFNQPEEKSVEWARRPEIMRNLKEARLKQTEESRRKTQNQDR